jgi:hypothetical protein
MTDTVKLRTQSLGPLFLSEAHTGSVTRVVVRLLDGSPDQDWVRTPRRKGFTLHRGPPGSERYLTAEATTNRSHVITAPKNNGFDRQTWRTDISPGHIMLGTSGRFLQADDTLICGNGFVVELVTASSEGLGSEWQFIS